MTLEKKIEELPPHLRQEVEDFVDYLLNKYGHKESRPLRQDWAGALKEHRKQTTSLELQRKTLEWRGD